jgi:hypothetical protein
LHPGRLATAVTAAVLSLSVLPVAAALDGRTAAAGLKEALNVGTGNAVDFLGRPDAYLGNLDVRIPMPEKLQFIEKAGRLFGADALADEFVTSMNRAAEAAAPLARDVFVAAIKEMSFDDALRIVRGKQHEATDYLQRSAGPRLTELFLPIVNEQLQTVGTTQSFERLMGRAKNHPLAAGVSFDLPEYVTGKALDGLFLVIAREEEKIRADPAARTTELLKTVFGAGAADEGAKKPWWKRVLSRDDGGGR